MFETAKIPGMIEQIEQKMLFDLASGLRDEDGVIVEFGCFFGRSTACLVNGAQRRWSQGPKAAPAVFAFDSFSCADRGGFARHVWAFAKGGGVGHLVRREGGRVDFYPVYRHFVGAAEDAGLLRTTVAELRDTTFDGGRIALMHIDAPKFYEEFKSILFRFFPALQPGGAVVFQDYFYHWSATLIAAAQLLLEAGFIRFERSAASALVARVVRAPTAPELLELDLAMTGGSVAELLDRSLEAIKGIALDRPERFTPRIHLAKVQHLWEREDFLGAQWALARMVQDAGGKFHPEVFADFQDLMSYGFTLRALSERDH